MIGFGNITIKTTAERENGELEVWVEACEERREKEKAENAGKVFLWAYLADGDGNEADRIFPIEAEEMMQFCMRVEDPYLWDAEECYLYDLILELRDEENRLMGCTAKKIAFRRWEMQDGRYRLNGKSIKFALIPEEAAKKCRKTGKDTCAEFESTVKKVLTEAKLSGKNALCMQKEYQIPKLHELCLEYGIYLLDGMPQEDELRKENEACGFELQVVEQGVLIENRNLYVDAYAYDLYYEILRGDDCVQKGSVQARAAAGNSRFVELPFAKPKEPGVYCYRAALCLKKDAAWAEKGYEVASGETMISNLWMN